jgi:hypothetical protein
MSAAVLQLQHFSCQFSCIQDPVSPFLKLLADLKILAEYTAKIASGEKNGA